MKILIITSLLFVLTSCGELLLDQPTKNDKQVIDLYKKAEQVNDEIIQKSNDNYNKIKEIEY